MFLLKAFIPRAEKGCRCNPSDRHILKLGGAWGWNDGQFLAAAPHILQVAVVSKSSLAFARKMPVLTSGP